MKLIKKQNGFTLVELLVAITVFVVVITSATAIYIAVIRSQQKTNAQRQTSQDARYAIETITREVRMATGGTVRDGNELINRPAIRVEDLDDNNNNVGHKLIIVTQDYNTGQTTEREFIRDGNRITVNGQPLTSDNIRVTRFDLTNFIPLSEYNPAAGLNTPPRQPSVTITITTEQENPNADVERRSRTTLRTTISSRDYNYAQ